jgi:hypothetical protein
MSSNITPIDISNMPELLDLVEEVEATKTPRELKRDDKVVAVLSPVVQKARATQESTGDALLRLARLGKKLQLKAPADLSSRIDDYLYGEITASDTTVKRYLCFCLAGKWGKFPRERMRGTFGQQGG